MKIINPANETVINEVEEDNLHSINLKIARLKVGQLKWKGESVDNRLQVIESFGKLVQQHKNELAIILTRETGKPITQSLNEINGSLNRIDHLSKNARKWLQPEELGMEGNTLELLYHEPLGVIGNISAWNFPYNVGFNVFLYALVAGNAVLYKPSEFASLTGLKIKELLVEAGLPDDVFEVAIGSGYVGQTMLESDLNGYFFTGSHKTGVHIAKTLTPKLVPVQLELGGKDPLYVMDDVASVKQAAINAAEGAFYNNGQSCCAVERIYVHKNIFTEFIEHFVEEVKSYKIGDPQVEDTFIGPLTRAAQMEIILQQITDATSKGAKILLGGNRLDQKGYYLEPTVITDVDHSMSLMKDESFGPVIGIQRVASDAEALALMQDTEYGLTAAVFSENELRAKHILDQMNVGTVYWNCCDRVSPNVPWSGRKNSGLGATLSYIGIRAFTQPKSYHLRS